MLHHTGTNFKTQANAAFLMGAYLITRKNQSVQKVKELFTNQYLSSLQPYRDAGVGPDDFPLTVVDCLRGLERAVELGWYSH